ncbi:MAG: cyclophane-containing peptide 2OG-Fe(II) oxygenase YhhC [Caulobacteraceae bacterium]
MIDIAAQAEFRREPFDHTLAKEALPGDLADGALEWMEQDASWKLRLASFYEQWEIHLDADVLPPHLRSLCAQSTVERLAQTMLAPLTPVPLQLTEITAHKLVQGQTIRIHNDLLDGREAYRLLVQLNRGWRDEQGGLLMIFASSSADDLSRVIRPVHGSAFAFAITHRSFHAVSSVRSGERYTLVFSFRELAES